MSRCSTSGGSLFATLRTSFRDPSIATMTMTDPSPSLSSASSAVAVIVVAFDGLSQPRDDRRRTVTGHRAHRIHRPRSHRAPPRPSSASLRPLQSEPRKQREPVFWTDAAPHSSRRAHATTRSNAPRPLPRGSDRRARIRDRRKRRGGVRPAASGERRTAAFEGASSCRLAADRARCSWPSPFPRLRSCREFVVDIEPRLPSRSCRASIFRPARAGTRASSISRKRPHVHQLVANRCKRRGPPRRRDRLHPRQ